MRSPGPMPAAGLILFAVAACGRIGFDPRVGIASDAATAADVARAAAMDVAAAATTDLAGTEAAPPDAPPLDAPAVDRPVDGPAPPLDAPAIDRPVDAVPPADAGQAGAPDALPARMAWCLPANPTAIFCEDFESGLPQNEVGYFRQVSPGCTLEISAMRPHRGNASLRAVVTAGASTNGALAEQFKTIPTITSGPLYARAFIYIATTFDIQGWFIPLKVGGAGGKTSYDLTRMNQIQLNVTSVGSFASMAAVAPRNQWFCAELAINVDGPGGAGFADAVLDGKSAVRTPTGTDTRNTSGIDNFVFGIENAYRLSADAEIFMDDVILARAPIGCQ